MDKLQQFYDLMKKEETFTLATSYNNRVTTRGVSPVVCDKKILFYTRKDSLKYLQLEKNNYCCANIGFFSAEATANFLGGTMLEENKKYRELYEEKFPDAFNNEIPFNGCDDEFILLTIHNLRGWVSENDSTFPTSYFDMEIK